MRELKRLFFAMEVKAPWPETFPPGRVLLEEDRHLTLAFLGEAHLPTLQKLLPTCPKPPFSIGLSARFDQELFLPQHSPRVVAYHLRCLEQEELFFQYQKELVAWIAQLSLPIKENPFLAHVTIARNPSLFHEWKKEFQILPCFTGSIRLLESLGSSRYQTCWEIPILAPFEPVEHTADLAFLVRGNSWFEFELHAWLALSFHEPSWIEEWFPMQAHSLAEVVRNLNHRIALLDAKRGSPFKAVSYHGVVNRGEWEMIVDV